MFGCLPFVWFVVVVIDRGSQQGIFSYLYKFAPYLTVLYWASLVKTKGLGSVTFAVKLYATIIGLRQIAVFMLPDTLGGVPLPNAVYDGTFIFAYVGSLPRVFGPGAMIMALAVLLYLGDWSLRRLTVPGRAGMAVAVMGLATTFTRGTLLVLAATATISVFLPLRFRRGVPRTLKTAVAFVCLAAIVCICGLAASGYLREALPDAGERVTIDTTTLDWRYDQVDRAFMRTEQWWQSWVFGVGPNTFVRNSSTENLTVNELHFSYISVLWTFGAAGLALLLASLLGVATYGWNVARRTSAGLEWYLGAWMFMLVGVYTPTFAEADSALGLTLCVGAVVGLMASDHGRTRLRVPVQHLARNGSRLRLTAGAAR